MSGITMDRRFKFLEFTILFVFISPNIVLSQSIPSFPRSKDTIYDSSLFSGAAKPVKFTAYFNCQNCTQSNLDYSYKFSPANGHVYHRFATYGSQRDQFMGFGALRGLLSFGANSTGDYQALSVKSDTKPLQKSRQFGVKADYISQHGLMSDVTVCNFSAQTGASSIAAGATGSVRVYNCTTNTQFGTSDQVSLSRSFQFGYFIDVGYFIRLDENTPESSTVKRLIGIRLGG